MNKPLRMLRALGTLVNPKHWGPFVEAAEITGFDHGFTVSWSQGGEDLALLSYLGEITNGTYIDVGAHHPDRFSVTRHLYQRGWCGVNIEANPELIGVFNLRRPKDVNLNFAVGMLPEYELTIFQEPAISTVNLEWEERFLGQNQQVRKKVKTPGIRLRQVLETYFPHQQVDLLTVDAEGSDFEVILSLELNSLPKSMLPKYVLIETPNNLRAVLEEEVIRLLISQDYELIANLPMSSILRLRMST